MSLRHGLLGLLAEGPASGYDLARRFSEALGSVWPASTRRSTRSWPAWNRPA